MLGEVLLSLGLVGLVGATGLTQHVKQQADTPYEQQAYYSGYPFYHSGYPFYRGQYPLHYPGQFSGYFPYYAPLPRLPVKAESPSYVYNGAFEGDCLKEGLYYVDTRSFVVCHSGQRTVQSCADGAANRDSSLYTSGKVYSMNDFCSENLLAQAAASRQTAPPSRT